MMLLGECEKCNRQRQRATVGAANPSSYYAIRGRVVKTTTEGGVAHIEALAQRYTGRPDAWCGGRDQVRVILTIVADKIHDMAR